MRSHHQDIHFLFGEEAVFSTRNVLFGQSGKEYTVEFCNFITQLVENASYHPILPGVDFDAYFAQAAIFDKLQCIGFDGEFSQVNSIQYCFEIFSFQVSVESYVINFLFIVFRVGEF